MPTPTGLPKSGERWRLTTRVHGKTEQHDVTVLERSGGTYWSLRVRSVETGREQLWVDASAWWSGVTGSHRLTYVQPTAGKWVEQAPASPQPEEEERTPLGVVVVISGEDPHQCEHWAAALDYVRGHARGDDPVHVSMFTLYWGEDD
jgi:hypothetical protein